MNLKFCNCKHCRHSRKNKFNQAVINQAKGRHRRSTKILLAKSEFDKITEKIKVGYF